MNIEHIREHAYLLFLDESQFNLKPYLHKSYSKIGEQEEIITNGLNQNTKVFGALEPFQGYFLYEFSKSINSANFINFVEYIDYTLGKKRKLFIILDNLNSHKSCYTEDELSDIEFDEHLSRIWLPTYSPKLNWLEYIWGDAKNYIANSPFADINELISAVSSYWNGLSKSDIQHKIGLNKRLDKLLRKF